MTRPAVQLVLFLKAPRPGFVKSRLAAAIGQEAALAAYRRMVEVLLQQLAALPRVELRFTPDDAASEMKPWQHPRWTARPQGTGDLGERLRRAFDEGFAAGADRVVVIGSDCPDVTPGDIHAAGAALDASDLVVGPAEDGGYWLIGLRAPQPFLFEQMEWSTPAVLSETLRRAAKAGLSVELLARKTDIDTEAEWGEFVARVQSSS